MNINEYCITNNDESLPGKMVIAVRQAGLATERYEPLITLFRPLAHEAAALILLAQKVLPSDPETAKAVRLDLKRVRCAVEKIRKTEKVESLRQSAAIDGVAKVIFNVVEPTEARMEAIENAEQLAAEQAKLARSNVRRAELSAIGGIVPDSMLLLEMNDQAWSDYVLGAKTARTARLAAEAKAAADAQENENARLADEARLRADNERLQQAAADSEKARHVAATAARAELALLEHRAAQERAEAQRLAAVERAEREKLERTERDRVAAAAAAAQQKAEAKAKAARAPDRDKLEAYMGQFEAIIVPELKSDDGNHILKKFLIGHGNATRILRQDLNEL